MSGELQLPPGFRFHPTDEELVMHYLCRKCTNQPIPVPIIKDIDLYRFDPWLLPGKLISQFSVVWWDCFSFLFFFFLGCVINQRLCCFGWAEMDLNGEKEWYFFSPRDRKYPNGSRPNRAAGTGYWKATGADKPIGKPKTLGIKKALVFYAGKAPRGEKTNWIMHEYRLAGVDRSARKKNHTLRVSTHFSSSVIFIVFVFL